MNVYEELQWRALIDASTPGLEEIFATQRISGYGVFDPTASSLHAGNLLAIMGLVHLQRRGHQPIAIVGGATGLIGDPSGKNQERQLLSGEQIDANLSAIRSQLCHFLDFEVAANPALVLNNADWFGSMGALQFLRDVGKHFSLNVMLDKESVRRRLEDGISFTEFSYQTLQAYDYLVLFRKFGCALQMGGSDQWGNITAGIELIRRLTGAGVHGLVFPLLTARSGSKFGKTESGTIWLAPELTSPYRFYQFWLNATDEEAVRYLRFFTLLNYAEIEALRAATTLHPEKRAAQRRLAREVTMMVHGGSALEKAELASKLVFGGEIQGLGAEEVLEVFNAVPCTRMNTEGLSGEGILLQDLLLKCGLVTSKSESRRLIEAGGAYVNNRKISELARKVTLNDSIDGKILLLRKGKKEYHIVALTD